MPEVYHLPDFLADIGPVEHVGLVTLCRQFCQQPSKSEFDSVLERQLEEAIEDIDDTCPKTDASGRRLLDVLNKMQRSKVIHKTDLHWLLVVAEQHAPGTCCSCCMCTTPLAVYIKLHRTVQSC